MIRPRYGDDLEPETRPERRPRAMDADEIARLTRSDGDRPPLEALLDLEAKHPQNTAAKEEAIRATLRLSPAKYYLYLHAIINTTEALEYDAITVNQVRRRLASRSDRRAARSTARREAR